MCSKEWQKVPEVKTERNSSQSFHQNAESSIHPTFSHEIQRLSTNVIQSRIKELDIVIKCLFDGLPPLAMNKSKFEIIYNNIVEYTQERSKLMDELKKRNHSSSAS